MKLGWWRLWPLLALAAGVLWALCFGRRGLVLAPWLALAPLMLLLGRGRPGPVGLLFGLGYWLAAIPWIRPTLVTYGGLPGWLAAVALLAAAGYLALFTAAFAALAARLRRRGPRAAVLGLPALWVALETARGWGPLAFPWNLAAYSLVEVPGALELAPWIGPWGLSYLVVAVNAALAVAIERRDPRPAVAAAVIAAGLLAAGAVAGGMGEPTAGGNRLEARLLQPNSAVTVEWDPGSARADYRRLLAQSTAACASGPALLVWPESAAWPFSYARDERLRRDVHELVDRGCPVLLNATVHEDGAAYNSVFLAAPGVPDQRYDKKLLVPFGETVPFARWLPGLRAIARTAGGFSPGRGDPLLAWAGERMGLSICFEIVFPAKAARQTRRGAGVLVTITNDGWYGDSTAPWQHFRAARFRAAENRRPVLRAAITGVSGVIAADGSVESLLGVGERGVLAAAVDGGRGLTVFSRLPWLVPALCWIALPFAIFRRGFRRGRASS